MNSTSCRASFPNKQARRGYYKENERETEKPGDVPEAQECRACDGQRGVHIFAHFSRRKIRSRLCHPPGEIFEAPAEMFTRAATRVASTPRCCSFTLFPSLFPSLSLLLSWSSALLENPSNHPSYESLTCAHVCTRDVAMIAPAHSLYMISGNRKYHRKWWDILLKIISVLKEHAARV